MKNKFKKSKIIIPALALITATTVASVTGTVAWFTAARTATVNVNAFATTKLDSQLHVTNTAGIATTVDTSTQSVSLNGKLTHGSYAATANNTGHLWVANTNDDGTASSYRDLDTIENHSHTNEDTSTTTDMWLAKDATKNEDKIWYGASWTMNFKYTASSDGETNYLLFDVKGSSFTNASDNTGTTINGFRIAFMTATKVLVVGGDSTLTHVKDANSTESFANDNYIAITDTTDKLNDDATNMSSNKFCFGQIDGATGVTLTCVAWFEGTDSSIVNTTNNKDTVMSNVNSVLSFYTRTVH